MHTSGGLRSEEANTAAWEGGRGFVVGATKWGIGTAILGAAGWYMSPVYRGLTIQFKTFIQMSGMILGGCLEADHRVREYEAKMRMQKRILRDRAMWEREQEE
ncbi:hypothetical protein M430DRAFT_21938 [Amorphotheca resinae ATCC 22711]|uniref:Imidazoleglycerol-phosphate dehydratase n=1 Tax=Amorphotheca resinae ATCC 22711 TaxID=857342 RepID=A0A2T3ASW4_AMORE|nr:hypothetical protein M430DRAFT_21938 [Amorphotheca resinae ATCC 22711]PSS10584.1 hypothetical protein M430DRAFT_21938 [Amorphotheca resinae ATCC 22711]